jgi:hypothetical protein
VTTHLLWSTSVLLLLLVISWVVVWTSILVEASLLLSSHHWTSSLLLATLHLVVVEVVSLLEVGIEASWFLVGVSVLVWSHWSLHSHW